MATDPGAHLWSKLFGDVALQVGTAVATDSQRNVVGVGYFQGTFSFGGADLSNGGGADAYVVKLTPDGDHIWSKAYPGSLNQMAHSVVVDAADNVVFAGLFNSSIDFGAGPVTGPGWQDVFAAKLDASGMLQWGRALGDTGGGDVRALVGVDQSGDVYVAAPFTGVLDIGCPTLTANGAQDLYLAKLDLTGACVWNRSFGDAGAEELAALAVAADGTVGLAGRFSGTVDLGSGPVTSSGSSDAFLAVFDSAGEPIWDRTFGSAAPNSDKAYITALGFDGAGNAIVTGSIVGSLDMGGGVLVAVDQDALLARYDTGGTHLWSTTLGGTGPDHVYHAAFDGSGAMLLSGTHAGGLDFGGGSIGVGGIFSAKLDPSGGHLWSRELIGCDKCTVLAPSVALDTSGCALLNGTLDEPADLGGGLLTPVGVSNDVLMAKFGP